MDIKLKINNDTLWALSRWFSNVNQLKVESGLSKVWVTIGYELTDRFDNMFKKISRQSDLFNAKKNHSVKLKYYQAYAFKELLLVIIPYVETENHLHFTLLNKVVNQLDQKLC
ncbi:hypothetical protein ACYSNM_03400 [Myroides sp. LJL116]